MKVDVQLSPAVETWGRLRDGVRVAEEAGFDTAWVFDHFAGSMLGGSTMLECFTLLGALAAVTDRIGVGSLVVNVNNRPAGVLAAAAATVQSISGGRLTLGLGAGAAPASRWSAEHQALGIRLGATLGERHRRLAATLDELDRLWSPSRSEELSTFAVPDPRPRIVLGVNSEALAEVAARRCQGINVRGDHPALERIVEAARLARAAVAADADAWETSVWAMWDPALLDRGHAEMRRWEALGVARLVMVFLTPHDPAVLRHAADQVRRLAA
jgi:alkanesulfonate monooxygenase SsuD/methylene tetrahydromethanopterin reductase-like flavin-dependent oxidoreductase (luciferase family)